MNIGLTGGIASGKSTVSTLLRERGALLVDADRIAREIVFPGSAVLNQIVDLFGMDMLLADGSLDRKRLGERVFASEAQRKQLETITHPVIREELQARMKQLKREHPCKLIVVDVPLLYESGLKDMFQQAVVVYAPRDVQLHRLMQRDELNAIQAELRLQSQQDIEEKRMLADVVIDNSQSLAYTHRQVQHFWAQKIFRC